MNSFEKQIVNSVRTMDDESLLQLVRTELQRSGGLDKVIDGPLVGPRRARAVRRTKAARVGRATADPKAEIKVLSAVKATKGAAMADLEKATRLKRTQISRAINKLLAAKKVFRAGERRFTRYATSAAAAKLAEKTARGS